MQWKSLKFVNKCSSFAYGYLMFFSCNQANKWSIHEETKNGKFHSFINWSFEGLVTCDEEYYVSSCNQNTKQIRFLEWEGKYNKPIHFKS